MNMKKRSLRLTIMTSVSVLALVATSCNEAQMISGSKTKKRNDALANGFDSAGAGGAAMDGTNGFDSGGAGGAGGAGKNGFDTGGAGGAGGGNNGFNNGGAGGTGGGGPNSPNAGGAGGAGGSGMDSLFGSGTGGSGNNPNAGGAGGAGGTGMDSLFGSGIGGSGSTPNAGGSGGGGTPDLNSLFGSNNGKPSDQALFETVKARGLNPSTVISDFGTIELCKWDILRKNPGCMSLAWKCFFAYLAGGQKTVAGVPACGCFEVTSQGELTGTINAACN
jgi:hypothetical protein